ncbi:MAG: hypothetical protein VX498_15065 [Myxococcota bacterium]|nr:hypothetical protein [Myxococcota bacterium]
MSSPPTRTAARSRLRRSLFGLWVLVASWALLELVLQLGALYTADEDEGLDIELDLEALRVLAIGDSWVAGAEAPDGQGFADHLGRELGGQLDPPRAVQLFNHGRTGANSAYVALTVDRELPRLMPQLIVVLVGQNNATNFYQVAEVEELLGARARRNPLDGLRTVKLFRILLANARGSSNYRGKEGEVLLPEIEPMERDDQDNPLNRVRVLGSKAGQQYLYRFVDRSPPRGVDPAENFAWEVLYATAKRDLAVARVAATTLRQVMGWQQEVPDSSAPRARNDRELLARYALLRLARQERNWRELRHHGGAFVGYEPRCLLSDLGAAEAHLLSGDWRRARAYLRSAHNRAPGFLDTADVAVRFPAQSRDPSVYEAFEFRPLGVPMAYERAAILQQTNLEQAAAAAMAEWLDAVPGDDTIRADLAIWLVKNGRRPEADEVAGLKADARDHAIIPTTLDLDLWRYAVLRAKATGEREHTLETVQRALTLPAVNAPLLGAMTEALSAHQLCDSLLEVADRWFLARGNGTGYVRELSPCMEPALAARRLESLRLEWQPLGDLEAWTALVKAGHRPFDLLYRDLDLVLERAEEVGAKVVLLNYPNPSDDHTALRDVLADYAAGRPVEHVDLWSAFASRLDAREWKEHLGPNGHANALGYRLMADEILIQLEKRRILATSVPDE